MDFSAICRICTGTKFLNPIYKDEDDYIRYSTAVFITTGLKVDLHDGLPQQMCRNCIKFVNDSLKFRKQCKDTEIHLLEIKNSKTVSACGKLLKNIEQSILKRKRSTDSRKSDSIYIKIEECTSENDDGSLKTLQKYTAEENIKIETHYIKNYYETNTNDSIESSIKTDLDKEESTQKTNNTDELKHEDEYLDDQFESNPESGHLATYINDTASNPVKFTNAVTYTATTPPPLISPGTNESNLDTRSVTNSEEFLGNGTNKSNLKIHKNNLALYINDDDTASKSVKVLNGVTYTATTPPPLIITESNESNSDTSSVTNSEQFLSNVMNKSNSKRNRNSLVSYIKDTVTNSEESNNVTNADIPFIIRDSNRVTCKLCQKDLSKRSIDLHISKRHLGADTRKVKCDLCDTYVIKQRLKRHRIKMHGRDCFRCGYCKTEFDSRAVLLAHVPTCTAKKRKRQATDKRKEKKVECDVCHKTMQQASLRLHQEIKHAGKGPVCEHCERRFGNKFRLKEHLRAKHGYEKFKCSMCEYRSASSMALRNHERRHRVERPFACTSCSARFHEPSLLEQHKQSHRTE